MKYSLKAPKNYAPEAVLYTITSLATFSYLAINVYMPHFGDIFSMLGAMIIMIASGIAAIVASILTLTSIDKRGRVAAYMCLVLLVAAGAITVVWRHTSS